MSEHMKALIERWNAQISGDVHLGALPEGWAQCLGQVRRDVTEAMAADGLSTSQNTRKRPWTLVLYTDNRGEKRWALKDTNGTITMSSSQGYSRDIDRDRNASEGLLLPSRPVVGEMLVRIDGRPIKVTATTKSYV